MEQEAVYLINAQTYLHLRENAGGVGYEVFDKNTPMPVEDGQIPAAALKNGPHRMEAAREYYLAEHLDEPLVKLQKVAVSTLEKFRSGVRKRRLWNPESLPGDDVRFIDSQYNELFRVPNGGIVQINYPDGRQYAKKVEYLDDFHMKIGSSIRHICEFAELSARSHANVEPEPLTQNDFRAWNLEYDFYLTVQSDNGEWKYSLYRGNCQLLEQGTVGDPDLTIEEVRDEVLDAHHLDGKECRALSAEEFALKLAEREDMQMLRMSQFEQSGHDGYLILQLRHDADRELRFASMRYLEKKNIIPNIENYEILYCGELPEEKRSTPAAELLEQLYQKFNCDRPRNFQGHSLSVSDVIMLNRDGKISAHYVNSIGFRELSGFQDKQERSSVLSQLKAKCDMPEYNPAKCRKGRDDHAI